jgi:uncharacterized protein with HEPN domain
MPRDKAILQDIVAAAERIVVKVNGVPLNRFLSDEDLQDILLRQITVMGEATRLLSEETRQRFPDIPWHRIAGMRNRLVHEYRDIDYKQCGIRRRRTFRNY